MTYAVNFAFLLFVVYQSHVFAWNDDDRVKLRDVATLTLYHGRQTTGRRSKPVAQLQCVGGSAGCSSFVPQVVQCYNRGSNGYDIQWECKTDMDNEFRFGKVTVTCEGYDRPDDKYILKGSCGLEYTLDLTREGLDKSKGKQRSYYREGDSSDYYSPSKKGTVSGLRDIIVLAVICIIVYGIYRTCIANQFNGEETGGSGPGPDPYHQRPSWFRSFYGNGGQHGSPPPSYGFRPDYMPNEGCGGGAPGRASSGSTNFWTGAATGGILGYMLGNRGNQSHRTSHSRGYDAWGGTRYSGGSGGESATGGSSGTRTASGFGETRRR